MYYKLGQALFYYKLGQTLQIGTASLLQIGASVVTNWGSYYKLGQPLLENNRAVLQIRAIITDWGITVLTLFDLLSYIYITKKSFMIRVYD